MRRPKEVSGAVPALPAADSVARPALRVAEIATGGKRFGALLQEFRRRAGMTQSQLAGLSTVSVRAIRDLELGRAQRPRRDTVRLLAEALRLNGERRAMLGVAAGHETSDAVVTASLSARLAPPPSPAGPFLGRDEEARILYDLLAAGSDRLIAVVGLGGVGKTRLVLAVVHALHERRRMPVLWAARLTDLLAPAATSNAVTSNTAMSNLNAYEESGLMTRDALDGAVDDLASFIGSRPFLLVLDDREYEDGGGYRGAADALASGVRADPLVRLLSQCPQLRVVTTSRSAGAARAAGRRLFPLMPFAVTEHCDAAGETSAVAGVAASRSTAAPAGAQACAPDPAAEIVHWHLRQVRPQWRAATEDAAAVRELCRLLDGIPLALESAAAWSLIASPARLAQFAASDPFAVAEPPGDCARPGAGRMRAALGEAVASLPIRLRELLAVLSTWDEPWSLDEVSTRLNVPVPDVSYAAHTLLVNNLIRPVATQAGGLDTFTVLNLVRHLMKEVPQAQAAPATPSQDSDSVLAYRRMLSVPLPRMSLVHDR